MIFLYAERKRKERTIAATRVENHKKTVINAATICPTGIFVPSGKKKNCSTSAAKTASHAKNRIHCAQYSLYSFFRSRSSLTARAYFSNNFENIFSPYSVRFPPERSALTESAP